MFLGDFMKDIGGYLELELTNKINLYHKNCEALNSGRNALRYIVRAYNIKEIWCPYYTCHVVWNALKEESCFVKFYHIDENFFPRIEFDENDFILYTNYFGICSENVFRLSRIYKHLIVDNSMSFFMEPIAFANFYSPRKFFGVPDGGIAVCKKRISEELPVSESYTKFIHLIKRIDCGSNSAYEEFNNIEASFNGESIKLMSRLTKRMLSSIDYESVKEKRKNNYMFLDEQLKSLNMKYFPLHKNDIPMFYPFYSTSKNLRDSLINSHIYIPRCWRETFLYTQDKIELELHSNLHLLIIDQRYSLTDMETIANVVKQSICK